MLILVQTVLRILRHFLTLKNWNLLKQKRLRLHAKLQKRLRLLPRLKLLRLPLLKKLQKRLPQRLKACEFSNRTEPRVALF